MPEQCLYIFVGSSNVVWTLYQAFEELGWQWRHFIHLNCHHHCTLWKCQNQDLGVYSHECCCNVMPEQCLYIFVGSSNVVWTLYQAFEELGWQWRHFIHLNCHHHCTLWKCQNQDLGVYSHECCCNVMPEQCLYIFVGSSNVVWTLYQAFEELGWQWRHFIHLNCHHHCTLWKCQNQDLGGILTWMCCNVMPEQCLYIFVGSSNVVWTLYQAFEELGWQWRHFIHLNCHHHCTLWKCQNQDLGVYSHECCCNVMPEQCLYIFVGSSNVVWTLYQAFEELGWQWRHFIHLNCHHHCTLCSARGCTHKIIEKIICLKSIF